ncbi:AIG2 family protein [Kribbella flavida DSM 17836]|uniref:AIG2 family protein n=1 Tax=Kribbella flavida (strain DSM 17836 / JCM 10339 / NBRC 14399) TaxID=479435 RepID=D2PKI2_KRIFD|nr:gamma-glutamylcyclotransferase [Kribbella flavida]ADB30494.1 AIG2 family protein [Kribbella flavida DSM 17836]
MTLYAAFASNLDPNLMADRCPYSPLRGTGWIVGWRLTFGGEELGWEGSMATVVEDPSDPTNQVFVALYDVHPKDVERLDEWEWIDQGVYRKIQVRVQTLDGEQLAWMYVLNAYEGGLPSARYLGILAEAAEAAGAPDDYVADLRARPCQSSGH